MLMLEIAGGILIAVAVVVVLFAMLVSVGSAAGGGGGDHRSDRQRAKDYARLVNAFRGRKPLAALSSPCDAEEQRAAWEEAFPDRAAKLKACEAICLLPFSSDRREAMENFYEQYPEERERDRINNWQWLSYRDGPTYG
jgi:hypothetical protein